MSPSTDEHRSLVDDIVAGREESLRALFLPARQRVPVLDWKPSMAALRPAPLRRLHTLWRELREGSGSIPAAAAVPERLGPLAGSLMVAEVAEGGDFRLLHVGQSIMHQCGHDYSGALVSQIGDGAGRFLAAAWEAVLRRGEPLHLEHEPPSVMLMTLCEQLVVPVAPDGDGRRRVLVGMAAESPLRGLVDGVPDPVLLFDEPGTVRMCNAAAERLFESTAGRLLGRRIRDLVEGCPLPPGEAATGGAREMTGRLADGSARQLEVSIGETAHRDVRLFVAIIRDVSSRKLLEAEIRRLAYHDALTGLANRLTLTDRLDQALARARRDRRMVALALIDLDGFKALNDTWGHRFGDAVLKAFADILSGSVREIDTVARLGGDEFALVQTDLKSARGAAVAGGRLLRRLAPPVEIGGREIALRASIGIALYPARCSTAEELFEHADRALYLAKRRGGNCLEIYAGSLEND